MQSSVALTHGRFASPRFALIFLPMLLAAALTPRSYAQVTYTGTAAAQNFGSQAVGVATTAVSFPFSVAAGTTVGSIAVLTQGTPGLDFTSAIGTTCIAKTYSSASTCTAKVTFTPKFPGARMGAIVFFSETGNTGTVLGKELLYGLGTGAEISYATTTAIAIDPSVNGLALESPAGLTIDAAGNLFIADSANNRMVEVPAGGGSAIAIDPEVNGIGLNAPGAAVVDGAGNLFIADTLNSRVVEVPAGGGAATSIDPTVDGKQLDRAFGLAVDGAGDLYIVDGVNARVVEVPTGGGPATSIDPTVNGHDLEGPGSLAIDGAGDLFISDAGYGRGVVEVPAGGGAAIAIDPTASGTKLNTAEGLAVDAAGDLFICDPENFRVVEVPAGGGAAVAIDPLAGGTYLRGPDGAAVDGLGGLFIADSTTDQVVEVQHSQPPSLSFPTATPAGSIDTADGPQTVAITNIGNEPLTFSALAYPADFSEPSGAEVPCTLSASVSPGAQCQIAVQFSPRNAGPLNEDITLGDNAQNGAGRQSIAVSGTGTGQAFMTAPTPGTTFAGSTVTFTWQAGTESSEYALRIGTGVGGNNLYQSPALTTTSVTVTGLPMSAQTACVRLESKVNGVWVYEDYKYIEAGTPVQAVLTSPGQGASVGPNQTFTWSAGTEVTEYFFQLGTAGVGSDNLFNTGTTTALTASVTGLPAGGERVYGRVGSKINGVWQSEDYQFTTYSLGELVVPTPGSTLSGSTVTFIWSGSPGASGYALRLGTSAGANNLYQSPDLTATSVTVDGLPTNGETIYATFGSKVNGTWLFEDYTYTAF